MESNNYIVSARKYRPSTFSTVVGQKNLVSTLQNAINTDRLAHSYLFCGSRGVGKTSCARIFAKTINCEHRTPTGDPCNECDSCRAFNEGRSFNIIEMDAASNNGVDDMRKLTEQVMVPPTDGRYRVFIIDEVHMLSSAAFNAFLKTLEEPPSYIIFILATTEKHKILPTILSRCQIYDFNRITVNDIVDHLAMVAEKEGVNAERKALSVIATQADGAMRDALSIFDQIVASSRGNVTYESTIENLSILDNKYFDRLMEAFAKSDVPEALLIFKEIRDKGFNTHFFIHGLQNYIRDLMVARDPRTVPLLDATEDEKQLMSARSQTFSPEFYFMALSLINDADLKFKEASNKTFLTELLLIKLCQLLSPSPVFRGKEEGHIDSLLPLGKTITADTEQISKSEQPAEVIKASTAEVGTSGPDVTEQITNKNQEAIVSPEQGRPALRKLRPVMQNMISLKKGGISVNDNHETSSTKEATVAATNELTDQAFYEAWSAYAKANPEKKLLVNLMHGISPKINAANRKLIDVTVNNELQKDIIEKDRAYLLPYLRKTLGSTDLDLNIEIKEGKLAPEMWSEMEVLENMIANHPEMKQFMSDLGLSLS